LRRSVETNIQIKLNSLTSVDLGRFSLLYMPWDIKLPPCPYNAYYLRSIILIIFIPGIPTFSSHEEERRHILIHTAATFRDFSRKGFTEGMSGHISVRDPEFPNYIWMNPLGKHFGLMTAGDLICLDVNKGKVVGGNQVTSSQNNKRFN